MVSADCSALAFERPRPRSCRRAPGLGAHFGQFAAYAIMHKLHLIISRDAAPNISRVCRQACVRLLEWQLLD